MPLPILAIAAGLAQFAPALIKYLAGDKAGDTAQKIVDVGMQVAGVSTPEEALKQISVNQALQVQFQTRAMELEVELDKAYLEDRQDARKRQVGSEQAVGSRDVNLYVLAWVVVIGFFSVIAITILADMPASEVAKTAISMLFGALIGGFKDVLGYFFGSSRGSDDKTKMLAGK